MEQKWTKITDGLPAYGTDVFIFMDGAQHKAYRRSTDQHGEHWYCHDFEDDLTVVAVSRITHWHPMLEDPKD